MFRQKDFRAGWPLLYETVYSCMCLPYVFVFSPLAMYPDHQFLEKRQIHLLNLQDIIIAEKNRHKGSSLLVQGRYVFKVTKSFFLRFFFIPLKSSLETLPAKTRFGKPCFCRSAICHFPHLRRFSGVWWAKHLFARVECKLVILADFVRNTCFRQVADKHSLPKTRFWNPKKSSMEDWDADLSPYNSRPPIFLQKEAILSSNISSRLPFRLLSLCIFNSLLASRPMAWRTLSQDPKYPDASALPEYPKYPSVLKTLRIVNVLGGVNSLRP